MPHFLCQIGVPATAKARYGCLEWIKEKVFQE
jgi:hypothetical protein